MSTDWIDQDLRPRLEGVASRDWKTESLADFMMGLHDRITAAVESGALSREDAVEARDLVRAAVRSIPGVTVVRRTETISTGGTARAVRRQPADDE